MSIAINKLSKTILNRPGTGKQIRVSGKDMVFNRDTSKGIQKVVNNLPFQAPDQNDIIVDGENAFNNVIKYKMAPDVLQAIKETFKLNGIDSFIDNTYTISQTRQLQKLVDIFKDDKTYVYPYIFPMSFPVHYTYSSGNYYSAARPVIGTFGYEGFTTSSVVDQKYNQTSLIEIDDSTKTPKGTQELSINNTIGVYNSGTVLSDYSQLNGSKENLSYSNNSPFSYMNFYYKDEANPYDFVYLANNFIINDVAANLSDIDYYREYKDNFDVDGNGKLYNRSEIMEKLKSYAVMSNIRVRPDFKNINYSSTNERGSPASAYYFNNNNILYQPSTVDLAGLFFIVRTEIPTYDVTTMSFDNSESEKYQYWFFNIKSLFTSCINGYTATNSGQAAIGVTDYANTINKLILGGSTGIHFKIDVKSKYLSSDVGKAGGVNFCYPFPLFIKRLKYFDQDYTKIMQFNVDSTEIKRAAQNGLTLFGSLNNFLDFYRNGLGLPITYNENELKYTNTENWADPPEPVPGSGGQTGGVTGGGFGIGGTTEGEISDDVPQGIESTGGARLNSAYALTYTQIKNFQNALNDGSIWTAISNIFKDNPTEGLISLNNFPFDLEKIININDVNIKVLGGDIESVKGTLISTTAKTRIDMGTFSFKERFGSFLDYDPFNKITLYLPFVGFRRINANDVMKKNVKLQLDVDFGDGSCLYMLKVEQNENNFITMYTWDGQIGTSVDLVSSDARENTQKKLKSAVSMIGTIAAGAATGGASVGVSAAIGSAGANIASNAIDNILDKPNYSGNGPAQSQHVFSIGTKPYIIFEYPELDIPSSQGQIKGYQVNTFKYLNEMSGFTQCADIKIEGLECTSEELNQIKNILEGGIKIQ